MPCMQRNGSQLLIAVFSLLLLMVGAVAAFAQQFPIDRYVYQCRQTPRIGTTTYPGAERMNRFNKLAMPPGKSIPADGQLVLLYARVFDERCVPISDAKVEMWQTNQFGAYRFATKPELATPYPVFAGAGQTHSDNLGEFMFETIFPGGYTIRLRNGVILKRAPHFNIKIKHKEFGTYETNVWFAGDRRNEEDYVYKKLSDESKQRVLATIRPINDPNGGLQAYIDITIPGHAWFRGF